MATTKRIQLRGISRAPSDRMTADGGCAESLNVYLDNDEIAPVIRPDTIDIGIPEGTSYDRIFIHKTLTHENYITIDSDRVGYYDKDKRFETIYNLLDESVVDITSVGNTLVIATDKKMVYAILSGEEYMVIDDVDPKISLSFVNLDQIAVDKDSSLSDMYCWNSIRVSTTGTKSAAFGREDNGYRINTEEDKEALGLINEAYDEIIGHNLSYGAFNAPILVRYAVTLYDDTILYASAPAMLGAGFNDKGAMQDRPVLILRKTSAQNNDITSDYEVRMRDPFRIGFVPTCGNLGAVNKMRDIIKSVDIYVSETVNLYPNRDKAARLADYADPAGTYTRQVILDPVNSENNKNIKRSVTSVGVFFKIKSYSLDEFYALQETVYELNGDYSGENLWTESQRFDSLAVGSNIIANSLSTYNNSILAHGASIILPSGLSALNGQHAHADTRDKRFAFRYHIDSKTSGKMVVYSENYARPADSPFLFPNKGKYIHKSGQITSQESVECDALSFISYPDDRCTKVDICMMDSNGNLEGVYYALPMEPHPIIPSCSYAWIGLAQRLSDLRFTDLGGDDFTKEIEERRYENADNKLLVSSIDNPFIFPLAKRHTFQEKVTASAIASSALSQGQFGQYPLYVFTDDGIWAMEVNATGDFVSSKPLSREVCVNPDSITSLDQSIVFVSEKGLMLLNGSQITLISPYMNGRHYTVERSAEIILRGQEGFDKIADITIDNTPFMSFMKNARIGYDYAGQRLICINPNEKYQYVYKLDTETWHKIHHVDNIIRPINSYPKCEVMMYSKENTTQIVDMSTTLDASELQATEQGIIVSRPFDLDEPDVLKTITDIRVRGQFQKGSFNVILLGSNDGINFYTISTLRGKAWKQFRLIILSKLSQHERISWVDIAYETKFTNRLR